MKEMRWGVRKLLVLASINACPATVRELLEQDNMAGIYQSQMAKIVTQLHDAGYISPVGTEKREGSGPVGRIYAATGKGLLLIEKIKGMI